MNTTRDVLGPQRRRCVICPRQTVSAKHYARYAALDLDRRLDCIGANELIRFECLVSVQIHNGNELIPGTSSVSTGCAVSTSANNGATVLLDGFHPGQLQDRKSTRLNSSH